ncbi:hypothetical protein [Haloimpatiens massiliensis]|uniref:hypothetical protein n=1 Tax=Haloimpatiens massiliensis TaxID=1658110 RepID=UPI000C842C9F|nr:hypothetical protein [Haloimpatiens massiliensis]
MENLEEILDDDLINENNYSSSNSSNSYEINTKIILELLNKPCSERMLSFNTDIPMHLIQLNVDRLIKKQIIGIKETRINDGKLENIYELKSKDIKFLANNANSLIISTNNICKIVKDIITNIATEGDKPSSVKAVFIKVNPSRMTEFKEDLNKLVEKYEKLEDLNEKEVYGFLHVLGPYNNEK